MAEITTTKELLPHVSDHPFSKRQLAYLSPWFEDFSKARMESLGVTGGFSGAVVWRVKVSGRDLCLRRWPQVHPSMAGLTAIHGLLNHVAAQGYDIVPVPIATRYGETFFVHEDHLWELTPWLPGEASFSSDPTSSKLTAAMQALARFHQAAQSYRTVGSLVVGNLAVGNLAVGTARLGPAPGLQQRLTMIQGLQQGELQQLWSKTRSAQASDLRELAFELLEGIGRSLDAVSSYLTQIVDVPLPLQWCLRDVRHDHVLFMDEQVSGLLDFGAAAVDSVACDLARLLGSIVNDHAETWQAGIAAYCRERQLSLAEQQAIIGFDHGGLLCSATNWVRWLFVEGQSFPQIHALHAQLLWLRDRLQTLASHATASVMQQPVGATGSPAGLPAGGQIAEKQPQGHEREHQLGHQQEDPLEHRPGSAASSGPHRTNVSPWMHT